MHVRSAGRAVWSPRQRRWVAGIAGLAAVLALGLGLRRLVRYYLLESNQFVLRHIEIEAGDTITRERICEYLNLREGMPLFAIDIHRRQQEFLRDAATIRSLTIKRNLPDRICVSVIEREPLARLARQPLAVDSSGCIFVRYLGIETLPCISGYPRGQVVPGARVNGMALAAIEIFEVLKNNSLPLQIVDVDVSHEDYLDCTMSDQRRVKLAWKYLGDNDARSNRFLLAQLKGLAAAMNSERGQGRGLWDATIPGRAYAR
jgi:cell division septal protein FtsQ